MSSQIFVSVRGFYNNEEGLMVQIDNVFDTRKAIDSYFCDFDWHNFRNQMSRV